MKADLRNVTLMAIDGGNLENIMTVVKICADLCNFEAIRVLTPFDCSEPMHTKIPPMDYEGYNRFLVKEMHRYCETSHMLVVQYDGFALNPNAWSNEFLKYDWLGARWWHVNHGICMGNGGFSLRSKRIMAFASEHINVPTYAPEDVTIVRNHGQILIDNGFIFGTLDAAQRFSQEFGKWDGQFGFHSRGTDIRGWITDPRWNCYATAREILMQSNLRRVFSL